jgi:hypothetical protein
MSKSVQRYLYIFMNKLLYPLTKFFSSLCSASTKQVIMATALIPFQNEEKIHLGILRYRYRNSSGHLRAVKVIPCSNE